MIATLRFHTRICCRNLHAVSRHYPLPLPDLPPPVQGWPSFWALRNEVEDYLYPLYDRGWGIKFLPRKNHTSHHDRFIAHLTTEYPFANSKCAFQFIADLSSLTETEKHHPSHFSVQHDKRPILNLYVTTHTALRPRWNEEASRSDPPLSRRVPGITRRDLRFAICLEHLYDEYVKAGKALEPRGTKVKQIWDRPTWEMLVSRFIRSSLSLSPMTTQEEERERLLQTLAGSTPEMSEGTSTLAETKLEATLKEAPERELETIKCPACGGPHRIQACQLRSQYPPSTLCYLCLEPHWWLDCPTRNLENM